MNAIERSELLHEFGLELHRAETVDLAVDVMIAFAQTDVLDLRADLEHGRSALHLEALDDRDAVAVGKERAVGVLDDQLIIVLSGCVGRRVPFVTALGADLTSVPRAF